MDNNEVRKFCIPEVVSSSVVTQQIEIDHILPDYQPEIMRIIHCSAAPYISAKNLSSDKLTVDLIVVHSIVYQSYDMSINTIKIENSYVKGIDFTYPEAALEADLRLNTEYCNCKATGKRKINIRTNIGIGYSVYAEKEYTPFELADDIEVKTEELSATVLKSICSKTVEFKESIEENFSDCKIIDTPCKVRINDYRVVSGKVVIKGDLDASVMVINDDLSVSAKVVSVPFGQIFDLNGAEDDDKCEIAAKCMFVNISDDMEKDASSSIEVIVSFSIKVFGTVNAVLPTDAYCTRCETECETAVASFSDYTQIQEKTVTANFSLGKISTEISRVNYLFINPVVVSSEKRENGMHLNIAADAHFIGSDDSKTAVGLSKRGEFTLNPEIHIDEDSKGEFNIYPENYSYSLSDDGELTVSIELCVKFLISTVKNISYVSSFTMNEDIHKNNTDRAAITVYFAEKGESLFDIGKRYNVEARLISDENGIDGGVLSEKKRLIIPCKA